jgi:hypothetical protein
MPFLRQNVALSVDRILPQAERARLLAAAARGARDSLIAQGRAAPSYRTMVDGRAGAAEETIRPGGSIVYRFNLLGEAASFALAFAIARSPLRSGRFKRSWFVAVDGADWTGDLRDIPPGAEVIVTNRQPYTRKIEVGGQKVNVPPGIVEAARQATRRRFPNLQVKLQFVLIPASGSPGQYILKGRHHRRDRAAGQKLTYPAVVINEKP